MYIARIPNRSSPPAVLLRESYRDGEKVKSRTLANLSSWSSERIEALRRALKGEFDGQGGEGPFCDRIFGVLFVLKHIAERLGLIRALNAEPFGKLAVFLVLARVAHQGSRLSAVRWAKDHAVEEVLGVSGFDENDLYAALDWLAQHQESIEQVLYRGYLSQAGKPPVLVLYDVTSSYLEGECNELGEYGYNRDGKKGKKQIVIGLLTADDGEPLAVRVFKGNTGDPKTVAEQITTLKESFGIEEVVFVGDRGMIKKTGKAALSEAEFRYITALTDPQIRKLMRTDVIQSDLFDIAIQELEWDAKRLVLQCNEAVRRKERHRRESKLERLQELITERNVFVRQSKRAKPEAGLRKLKSWVKRHKISTFVTLILEERELKLTIDETLKTEEALLDGCYVLETDVSKEKMDAETVDARYRDLQRVERDFRDMKTAMLEVRPIFLRNGNRTRAHVFVAMLALRILRVISTALNRAFGTTDVDPDAITVDDALRSLSRLCFHRYLCGNVQVLHLPQLDERQKAIFAALGIRPPSIKPIHL